MTDNIEIPVPEPKDVQNIIERPEQAMSHVVSHEGRITKIEQEQAQRFTDLLEQIEKTRSDIFQAIEQSRLEQANVLEQRLNTLEERAAKLEAPVVEAPKEVVEELAEVPGEAVQIVPEVEASVEPTIRKGLRMRRKEKHKRNG